MQSKQWICCFNFDIVWSKWFHGDLLFWSNKQIISFLSQWIIHREKYNNATISFIYWFWFNRPIHSNFMGTNQYLQLNVTVTSISFEQNGYTSTKFYLFSQNGSFTGKSISTPLYPQYIGFDSKGRFIQISKKQISIYNWKRI